MRAFSLRSKGFTLIELLVVIAIIGLLASIILASLNTAQEKGRDARRISDLKEIQLALELYYDGTGNYPLPTGATAIATGKVTGTTATVFTSSNEAFGLTPTYISTTPADPSQPSDGSSSYFYYQYEPLESDGVTLCTSATACQAYLLVTYLEAAPNTATWTGTGSLAGVCPSGGGSVSPYPYCVHS